MLEFQQLYLTEEPCFTADNVEISEEQTQVQVKGAGDVFVDRTRVLITTNNHVWQFASGEESALRDRIFVFENLRDMDKKEFRSKSYIQDVG